MVRIEMLPAAHGDCLWIEWSGDGRTHRMLVDGGPAHTYPSLLARIAHLPEDAREFDLLIVTHIDADHIEGIVRLLRDAAAWKVGFRRVWFNGRPQLDRLPERIDDDLGAVSGEYLGLLLDRLEAAGGTAWNDDFADGIVCRDLADDGPPVVSLPGGLTLTLLSPELAGLRDLDDEWSREMHEAGIETGNPARLAAELDRDARLRPLGDELGGEPVVELGGEPDDRFPFEVLPVDEPPVFEDVLGGTAEADRDFGDDPSTANGSSIAVLAEWESGPSALLAGDAHADVLARGIREVLSQRGEDRLSVDVFKLPHHGSVGNLTEELLALLRCRAYLVSTNGAVFGHPHRRAIELLVEHHAGRGRPRLHFNYRSDETDSYADGNVAGTVCIVHFPDGSSLTL